MTPLDPLVALGERVDAAFAAQGGHNDAFPAIARAALEEARLHEVLDPQELARWGAVQRRLPPVPPTGLGTFGQPAFPVFVAPRFYIEVLYWLDDRIGVHQHAFSGAFQVLMGRCIQPHYRFDVEESVSERLLLGRLSPLKLDILGPGAICEIPSGPRFVHANLHLDRPTVTVVVRTTRDARAMPQLSYLPPSLAWDIFDDSPYKRTVLALVAYLRECDRERYDAVLVEHSGGPDLEMAFAVLHQEARFLDGPRFERVAEALVARHGQARSRLLCSAIWEVQRQERLYNMTVAAGHSDVRDLLSLLAIAPGPTVVREALGGLWSPDTVEPRLAGALAQLVEPLGPGASESLLGPLLSPTELVVLTARVLGGSREAARERLAGNEAALCDLDLLCDRFEQAILLAALFRTSVTA